MTCKEKREMQLDELKNGIDELTYCIDVLSYGNFTVSETITFQTLQEAQEYYSQIVQPHGPYYPGFLRCYARVPFSGRA